MTPKNVGWRQAGLHAEIFLFVVPTLILIGLFQYYPAGSGVFHSFFRWNGADISEYVGLGNYLDLLRSSEFWDSFSVAFFLGGWNVLKMIPALIAAVCIHRCGSERVQFIYRVLFVVPMVIPGLVVVLIWRSFFFEATSGYLNLFLDASGLLSVLEFLDRWLGWGGVFAPGKSPAWLGDPRLILTACVVWGFPWVGSFAVLTHLAKLEKIPKAIYESAEMDGANWWTKFTKIELPMMMGSIYILLVFVIIDTVRDAGMILALAGLQGGPGGKATVPALFMLRKAFVEQNMGYACAVGIVLTAVVMCLQKASTAMIEGEAMKPGHRNILRGLGLVAAASLLAAGRLIPVAVLLLAASVPYRTVARVAGFDAARRKRLLARLKSLLRRGGPEGVSRLRLRPPIPPRLAEPAWKARLLRSAKHGYIIGVLAFAFLPVYLMAIVSVKSNQQFYAAPAAVTAPFHWENLVTAWTMVTPTVANSVFISISATALTMLFGLMAAYFFARVRTPASAFLWNAVLILMMMPTIANLVPLFRLLTDLDLLNTLSALIIVSASAGQVFAIFVLRNFIADIPQEMFDAAEVDGANHFDQMRLIVVPQAGAILGTVGVMHFVTEWNNFVLPLIVMRDHARLPVMVQLLRMSGEYIKLWGPLMAGYALASIPIVILFVFSMRLFMRGMSEGMQ